jgi:hypothetical protein
MSRIMGSMFATVAACAALVFGAAPASADICADLFDECEIAEDIFEWNFEQLAGFFPLDDATCTKMTQTVYKQCEKNVNAAVKCWVDLANSLPKTAKPACKAQGDAASQCNAIFKSDAENDVEEIESFGDSELDCCGDIAEDFLAFCVEGF